MSIIGLITVILIIIVLLWAFTRFYLRGEDLSRYDRAPGPLMKPVDTTPSEAHFDVLATIEAMRKNAPSKLSLKEQIPALRKSMEEFSVGVSLDGLRIQAVDVAGVPAEWVVADDADPNRRLLYIHGGSGSGRDSLCCGGFCRRQPGSGCHCLGQG